MRIVDGDNEQRLIDIGGNNVTLLGEVDALADDVVATVLDFRYPATVTDTDAVAHCYGIGRAYSLDAEIALHLTIK